MKKGVLVRYAPFPHVELHESGMIGVTISEVYVEKPTRDLHLIDVVWGNDRGSSYPSGTICQEFVDELEIVT